MRARISVHYDGAWRPLLWFRIGKDGSVYLGLLQGQPAFGASGNVSGKQTVNIKYKDGKLLTARDLRKGSRVSFKASGEIHMSSRNLNGESLEHLAKPRQLCLALFTHPSRYRPRAPLSEKNFDVELADFPIDETRPLYASVHIAPWDGTQVNAPQGLKSMKVWQSLAFGFSGLTRAPDYALGITIGHGVEGPWPRLPHLAIAQPSTAT